MGTVSHDIHLPELLKPLTPSISMGKLSSGNQDTHADWWVEEAEKRESPGTESEP